MRKIGLISDNISTVNSEKSIINEDSRNYNSGNDSEDKKNKRNAELIETLFVGRINAQSSKSSCCNNNKKIDENTLLLLC